MTFLCSLTVKDRVHQSRSSTNNVRRCYNFWVCLTVVSVVGFPVGVYNLVANVSFFLPRILVARFPKKENGPRERRVFVCVSRQFPRGNRGMCLMTLSNRTKTEFLILVRFSPMIGSRARVSRGRKRVMRALNVYMRV